MITGFQIRAALAISKLNAKELAAIIGLHPATLLRFKKVPNLEYLNCHTKNIFLLQNFFNTREITFPNFNSIKFSPKNSLQEHSNKITRFHLVVARIATGLNQNELSKKLNISAGTISILENMDNTDIINNKKIKNSTLIIFFKSLGIVFNKNFTVTLEKDPKDILEKIKNIF